MRSYVFSQSTYRVVIPRAKRCEVRARDAAVGLYFERLSDSRARDALSRMKEGEETGKASVQYRGFADPIPPLSQIVFVLAASSRCREWGRIKSSRGTSAL